LFQPSSNPRHIEDLLRLRLETIQMREPVHGVRLVAVTTVRLNGEQNMLWEDAGSEHELALLVDRLGSRLGKENVFRIQTQVGALPERAYREVPFANSPKARRGGNAARSLPPHRPLWLQQPPLPLSVMSVAANADADGPPDFFQYQNTQHDVARHWGPERIETGWWRGPGVRRDYYRVETKAGYRFWIFRRLADGAWFVHGCFE
jgi:protein ImuB